MGTKLMDRLGAEPDERALAGGFAVAGLKSTPKSARGQAIDLWPIMTLLARIEEKYHPEQVWLFGSRARGDARQMSDWDLLVVVPDATNENDLHPLTAWRLQKGSGVYADVIPCRVSEFRSDLSTVNTVSYAAATEGVLIYER